MIDRTSSKKSIQIKLAPYQKSSLDVMRNDRKRKQAGAILVLMIFLIAIFIGFCALVIDIGRLGVVSRQLQSAVDFAALAGVDPLRIYWEPGYPVAGNYTDLRRGFRRVKPRIRQMFIRQKIYGAPIATSLSFQGSCNESPEADGCSIGDPSGIPASFDRQRFDPKNFNNSNATFVKDDQSLTVDVARFHTCQKTDGASFTTQIDRTAELYCIANMVKVTATLKGYKHIIAGVFESALFGGSKNGISIRTSKDIIRTATAVYRPYENIDTTCTASTCLKSSCGRPKCEDIFIGAPEDLNLKIPCKVDDYPVHDPDWQ